MSSFTKRLFVLPSALALLCPGPWATYARADVVRLGTSGKAPEPIVSPVIPPASAKAPLAGNQNFPIAPTGQGLPLLAAPNLPAGTPETAAAALPPDAVENPPAASKTTGAEPKTSVSLNNTAAQALSRGLSDLSQNLAPQLAAASRTDQGANAVYGIGSKILSAILGQKASSPPSQDVWPQESIGAFYGHPSALADRGYPGDDVVLGRKLTETIFVVLDTEISSFIPFAEVSAPIDIGAVKFRIRKDGTLKILGRFTQRVNPGDLPVSAEVTALTAITNGDVRGQPGLARALPQLLRFLGEDSVILAHNAPFDISHLAYRARELGLPLPPQPILDIKDIAKSLFPGLKSYSVEPLMALLHIGDIEDHQGASDSLNEALIFSKSVQRLAEKHRAAISDLTVRDIAAHSAPLRFNSILDRLTPLPVEPDRARPVPANPLEAERVMKALQTDRHRKMLPNMLRDVAYALGFDYAALLDKLRQANQLATMAPTDEILGDLIANPPSAAIFDFDSTLVDQGPAGISLPINPPTLRALLKLLKTGLPTAIMTMRSLDHVLPTEGQIPFTLWEPLMKKIPPYLRRNLFFSGRVGGELVLFNWRGKIIRCLDGRWTDEEQQKYRESMASVFTRLDIPNGDFTLLEAPGQLTIQFKKDHPRSGEFASALAQEFQAQGFPYPVMHNKEWVYFNKFDKGDGIRLLLTAMKARGFPVTTESILYVADEFRSPIGRPAGGDAAAAEALPQARMISVGDSGGDPVAPNVRRLGIEDSRGSRRVLEAIYKGLTKRISRRIRYLIASFLELLPRHHE